MTRNVSRRTFLGTTGAVAAGASLAGFSPRMSPAAEKAECSTPSAAKLGWSVSCQAYTFRRFSFYEMLDKLDELGVLHAEPGYFLPLDKDQPGLTTSQALSPVLRKQMRDRMALHGVTMPTHYANLGTNRQANVRMFEFAKEMGVDTIVSEPPLEAFDMVEELCDEYEINLAIHNHPKSPTSRFWSPDAVLAACQGRGKRIGACCDTGHWLRSGLDVMECLRKMKGRVNSFHLKDVGVSGKPDARDVPLGQGLADYRAVLTELSRQGFRGVMAIEYEHDSPKLMKEVGECLAFVEKTCKQLVG